MKQFLVVSYDIPDDRRRLKVMKTLKNFGMHTQYSVFECRLKPEEIRQLRERLQRLVGRRDSVRLYFISADDVSRIEVLGSGRVAEDSVYYLQ